MTKETELEGRRVTFEHALPAHMMAIDGTWRRACIIKDVSEAGATLQVDTSIEGLALSEFFLLLFLDRVGLSPVSARSSERRTNLSHFPAAQGERVQKAGTACACLMVYF
ncbi:hypothetical protein ACVWWO_007705 [Bradyrhizobium sp. F1.13.1]